MTNLTRAVFFLLIVLGASAQPRAEQWPQFRGLRAGVADDDPSLPDTWGPQQNVAWKIDVPGRGWSSPIVWGDHIIVTSVVNANGPEEPLKEVKAYTPESMGGTMTRADITSTTDSHRWVVYDVDFRTGKIRWETTVRTGVPSQPRHQKNSYASETPVTDGERVYAYFGSAGLFALDMNGKLVWSHPMRPFKVRNGWSSAGSPVVHKDRVYIVNDNDEQSFIAAYDSRTGGEVWRTNRDEGSNWTTPFVWENDQRTEIVTAGTGKVRSYGLDGKLLWELVGMSMIDIPTPFAGHGLLYVTSGHPSSSQLRPAYAIRPGASGDISLKPGETRNAYIVWSQSALGPYNPSPLVHGDYYYTLLDAGFLVCHDARTGRQVYPKQRITGEASGFTASLWSYNGKIFAMSEDGDTFVLQAGPEFKVLGKNSVGEMTLATPAVAHGSLIVRTASRLYRLAKSANP